MGKRYAAAGRPGRAPSCLQILPALVATVAAAVLLLGPVGGSSAAVRLAGSGDPTPAARAADRGVVQASGETPLPVVTQTLSIGPTGPVVVGPPVTGGPPLPPRTGTTVPTGAGASPTPSPGVPSPSGATTSGVSPTTAPPTSTAPGGTVSGRRSYGLSTPAALAIIAVLLAAAAAALRIWRRGRGRRPPDESAGG